MNLCACMSVCTCVWLGRAWTKTQKWNMVPYRHRMCRKNLKGPYRPCDFQRSRENPGIRGWHKTWRKGLCHIRVVSGWNVIWLLNNFIALSPGISGRHCFPMSWQRWGDKCLGENLSWKLQRRIVGVVALSICETPPGYSRNDLVLIVVQREGWLSIASLHYHHADISDDAISLIPHLAGRSWEFRVHMTCVVSVGSSFLSVCLFYFGHVNM